MKQRFLAWEQPIIEIQTFSDKTPQKCCEKALYGFVLLVIFVSCAVPPKQEALDILKRGLEDKSIIIRINAARGFAVAGDSNTVGLIYDVLAGEDNNAIVAALRALYDLGQAELRPCVTKLVEHTDPLVRSEAYRLIGAIDHPSAKPILEKGVKDKIPKIRRICYQGLEKFKARKLLTEGLKDFDPLVRIMCARGLAKLGEKGMENFVKREMVTANLDILKLGVIALAQLHDTTSISYIKDLLHDTPTELQITAAEALLIFGDQTGTEVLTQGLRSADPFVRIASLEVLEKFKVNDAFEALKEAVADEYINVSIGAIEVLSKYWPSECKKLFQSMLDRPSPLIRIAAATAFLETE